MLFPLETIGNHGKPLDGGEGCDVRVNLPRERAMNDDANAHIAVYGATGRTGRLVCRELAERGLDFIAGGRNVEKLQSLSAELGDAHGVVPTLREASVDESRSLDALVRDTSVLVNCAGPFTDIGRPVARAAVRNGAHYLDTTGEQSFIKWIDDELGHEAESEGLVLMPGCAYEYATGAIVSKLAVEQGAERVVVSYGVSGMNPSAGTKKSMLRSISEPGWTYRGGRLVPTAPASEVYEVPRPGGRPLTGLGFAGGEPIFVPKFGEVEYVDSCVVVDDRTARVLSSMSGMLPTMAGWATSVADPLIDWFEGDRSATDDGDTPFQVVAFEPREGDWYAVLSGYEPYDTTARIIVESARRLRDRDDDSGHSDGGYRTPASLWSPTEFADSVGVDVEIAEK